jgi:hypothetical protein
MFFYGHNTKDKTAFLIDENWEKAVFRSAHKK